MPVTTTATSESYLIEQIRQGNVQAFSELYDKYAPALSGIISKTAAKEKAEELLQASFLNIVGSIEKYNPSAERLFTWMLKIVRSAVAEAHAASGNKAEREIHANEHLVNATTDRHHSLGNEQELQQNSRPHSAADQQHSALELVSVKGKSFAEAATQLGISVSEVRISVRNELKHWRTLH